MLSPTSPWSFLHSALSCHSQRPHVARTTYTPHRPCRSRPCRLAARHPSPALRSRTSPPSFSASARRLAAYSLDFALASTTALLQIAQPAPPGPHASPRQCHDQRPASPSTRRTPHHSYIHHLLSSRPSRTCCWRADLPGHAGIMFILDAADVRRLLIAAPRRTPPTRFANLTIRLLARLSPPPPRTRSRTSPPSSPPRTSARRLAASALAAPGFAVRVAAELRQRPGDRTSA